jgi:cyanophycinase
MLRPKGKLIIIGGKEHKGKNELDMAELNKDFIEFEILKNLLPNGKTNKNLEIITTASNEPDVIAGDYKKAFAKLGHTNIDFINIENRMEAKNEEYINRVKNAYAVLFTGGDQFRLSTILGGTDFIETIKKRYMEDEHFKVAATSAGAMAMSKVMLYEGHNLEAMLKDDVKTNLGLGFLDNCIIDTHFVKRGRMGRLTEAVISNPPSIGIGLGEDTALIITNGDHMFCCGSGMVTIIDGHSVKHTNVAYAEPNTPLCVENITLHILAAGNAFKLKDRKFIPAEWDIEREKTSVKNMQKV